jgi:hypothetical protein
MSTSHSGVWVCAEVPVSQSQTVDLFPYVMLFIFEMGDTRLILIVDGIYHRCQGFLPL